MNAEEIIKGTVEQAVTKAMRETLILYLISW